MRIMKISLVFFVLFMSASVTVYAWTPGLQEAANAVALGRATPQQKMMVFLNNKEVNLLAQEGKITEYTYVSCQDDFFKLNEKLAKQAVKEAGFDPSISDRKYNPGTDTDVNINAKGQSKITLKDVETVENNYQEIAKQYFKQQGLDPPEGRIDTETDFMPNPEHTTPDEFDKAVKHINNNGGTAYTDPKSATTQAKLGSNQPVSIDEASSFTSTMKDMAQSKIQKANQLRNEANAIRSSNPGKAEVLDAQAKQFDYQAAKYYGRIDKVNNNLKQQYGLPQSQKTSKGLDKAIGNIDSIGRVRLTAEDAAAINSMNKSALQRATDQTIDTLLEIAKRSPSQTQEIGKALAREINALPLNRAGQAIDRIDDAMKGLNSGFTRSVVAEAKALKRAAAATKWTSFKNAAKNISGIKSVTKLSVAMTAGGAILMAHQGITITLDNVKATDTLWDFISNCFAHSAWEGTGIGPAFEQAQQEELERYEKEYEAGQDPSMVKSVTFTILKTGTYMGKDVILGILYLPDTIWEYFTEEKAQEGYATMQNQLAAVMRQMILDRKDFDKLMSDMKKIGLQDADAGLFLNCMCRNCGGTFGGTYNPGFETDMGHGPCQCSGPLSIWKTPLPVKDKDRQYECFNQVTKVRYDQAQDVFNQWRQQMVEANAQSVQAEVKQIEESMAKDDYMAAADAFNAIKDLIQDYMVTKVYDGKPQGENLSNSLANAIVEGLRVQAKAHAEDLKMANPLNTAVQKMTRACTLNLNTQWCEKERAKYSAWEQGWNDVTSKEAPEVADLLRQGKINSASTALWAINDRINKQQLPPRHHDPILVSLDAQFKAKRNEYNSAMKKFDQQVATDKALINPRGIVESIAAIKEAWEHSPMTLEWLNRESAQAAQNVRLAEENDKAGDAYQEQNNLANAIDRYQASLKLQKDEAVQRKLSVLLAEQEKAQEPAYQPDSIASAAPSNGVPASIIGNWTLHACGFSGDLVISGPQGAMTGKINYHTLNSWEPVVNIRYNTTTGQVGFDRQKYPQAHTGIAAGNKMSGKMTRDGLQGGPVCDWTATRSGPGAMPEKDQAIALPEPAVLIDETSYEPARNLARGKPTSQSSTGFGGAPERAVDGNTSGHFASNSVTHTNQQAGAWWQVDLGTFPVINFIRLWNRTDCCSERLGNFYVLVADQPFPSGPADVALGQPNVFKYHHEGVAGQTTDVPIARQGRYVRVQLGGSNYLSLAEVEVMGRPEAESTVSKTGPEQQISSSGVVPPVGGTTNLALNKPASQSSVYFGTGIDQGAQLGVDGVIAPDRDPEYMFITNTEKNPWWRVDLLGVYALTKIKLYNRINVGERAKTIQVDISADGSNWQTVYDNKGKNFKVLDIDVKDKKARYVKVQLNEYNYLHLFEVEVFGYAGSTVPVRQDSGSAPKTGTHRYTVDSVGIITDSSTGLQWFPGPDHDTDWDQAASWVKSLTVAGGGWRLPSIAELREIHVKMGQAKVGLNHIAPEFKLGANSPDKFKMASRVWADKVSMGGATLFDYSKPDGYDHISSRDSGYNTRAYAVRFGR